MKNEIAKNNKKHQEALDIVEQFKAKGGVVQELPVAVNGKSRAPTNFTEKNGR